MLNGCHLNYSRSLRILRKTVVGLQLIFFKKHSLVTLPSRELSTFINIMERRAITHFVQIRFFMIKTRADLTRYESFLVHTLVLPKTDINLRGEKGSYCYFTS